MEGDEGLGRGWCGRGRGSDLHSNIPEESIKDQRGLGLQTFLVPTTVGKVSVGVHACGGLKSDLARRRTTLVHSLVLQIAHAVGRGEDVSVTLCSKKCEPCDLSIGDLEALQTPTTGGVLKHLALARPDQHLSCEKGRERSLERP